MGFIKLTSTKTNGQLSALGDVAELSTISLGMLIGGAVGGAVGLASGVDEKYHLYKMTREKKRKFLSMLFQKRNPHLNKPSDF